MAPSNPVLPPNSLVLVTGINSFLGSNIADLLLSLSYRVRGTVRSLSKVASLRAAWEKKHGPGRIEFVVVEDMTVEGCFEDAVKGAKYPIAPDVTGVIHTASILTFDPNPNNVIPPVLSALNSLLITCLTSPTLTRFIYTSSCTALTTPKPNTKFHIDASTWNHADIALAHAPPPYTPDRGYTVYASSKTEAELALWKFVEQQQPRWVANAVLPETVYGRVVDGLEPSSTAEFPIALYHGRTSVAKMALKDYPPQYFVDVEDIARLHVSALLNPTVKSQRLIGFSEPINLNDVLRIMRKLKPARTFIDDFQDESLQDLSTVDTAKEVELLRGDWGRDGWTRLEESIGNNIRRL